MNNISNSNREINIDIISPNMKSKSFKKKICSYIFLNFGFRIKYLK